MLTVPGSRRERLLSQRTYKDAHPLSGTHAATPHTKNSKERKKTFVDSIARVPKRLRASPFKVPDKIGVATEQPSNSRSPR